MVDMNRRNVLTGLGAAAAGSGMVFGSGAFTQVQAERQVTINVDEDAQALVELDDNDSVDAVNSTGSGGAEAGEFELNSSFVAEGSQGFNVNSTVEIGNTTASGDFNSKVGPAFELRSNAADPIDVKFDLSGVTGVTGDTDLTLYLRDKSASAFNDESITVESLSDSETVQGAFIIDTGGSSDDLAGTITVTAGPNDQDVITTTNDSSNSNINLVNN